MNMEIAAATSNFLADRQRRGCMASTLHAYAQMLRWFTGFLARSGVSDTACISASDIAAYVESMRSGPPPLSAVTIHRRLAILRVYMRWLADEDLMDGRVLRRTTWPRKPDRLPKALYLDQAKQLLTAEMTTRDRAIVALILDTGIRESECCALDMEDLDIEGSTLTVLKGKGAKQRMVIFEEETKRLLRLWLAARESSGPALFVALHSNGTSKAGERLSDNGLYTAIKRAADNVGLGKAVSPHRLRHTMATMYLDSDGKIEDLSKLLGHSDISTTMGYVRISREKLKRAHVTASPMNRLKRGD